MFPDFGAEYNNFIAQDGTMKPPVVLQLGDHQTWMPDADGLLMTAMVSTVDGSICLLSALFRMPYAAATMKMRQQRFPAKPYDMICIKRKIDEVVGQGGERYSRFEIDVPKPAKTAAGNESQSQKGATR